MTYWLIKSEPNEFSFDDLLALPAATTPWDGVRNYQARNFMRDEMKPSNKVLFYHSNTKVPGVVGIAEVASEPYPDRSQFDAKSPYYDEQSSEDSPRWILVDIRAVKKLPRVISLTEIKQDPALAHMRLVQKGNRLSVMPVDEKAYKRILALAQS